MTPLIASALVVAASAILAPRVLHKRPPLAAWSDLVPFALGVVGMIVSAMIQVAPASTWSWFIDLGSFAVGTSLLVTCSIGSWPRRVGALILGIHAAQVVFTNTNAVLPMT